MTAGGPTLKPKQLYLIHVGSSRHGTVPHLVDGQTVDLEVYPPGLVQVDCAKSSDGYILD
jgi:hypothetical protein